MGSFFFFLFWFWIPILIDSKIEKISKNKLWNFGIGETMSRTVKWNVTCILFVTSNHKSCFPQFFPRVFLILSSWKRKQSDYWSKTVFILICWPIKFVFFFNCLNWEKFVEKFGKIRFVVWWFDVTNKILNESSILNLEFFWLDIKRRWVNYFCYLGKLFETFEELGTTDAKKISMLW